MKQNKEVNAGIVLILTLSFLIFVSYMLKLASQEYHDAQFKILHQRYPKMTMEIFDIVHDAAIEYDDNSARICAQIYAESRFNPHAVSPSGAEGLLQLMPRTAKELGVKDVFDIKENVRAGVKHYNLTCLRKAKGSHYLALKYYHAGCNRSTFSYESERYALEVLNLSITPEGER